MKRRNDGTGSKTETKSETKTTSSEVNKKKVIKTKARTKTIGEKPAREHVTEAQTTQ